MTSADLASHALIQEETSRRTPAAQYLSEEGDRELASFDFRRRTWVVDPLDGTVNYVYGQRHVGISLAYVVDGEVQVGVVHGPFYGETFVAVRGRGAMLDGRELPRRPAVPLASALISTGFPHRRDGMDAILDRFERVARRAHPAAHPTRACCAERAGYTPSSSSESESPSPRAIPTSDAIVTFVRPASIS